MQVSAQLLMRSLTQRLWSCTVGECSVCEAAVEPHGEIVKISCKFHLSAFHAVSLLQGQVASGSDHI